MEKKDHVLLGAALTVGAVEDWLGEHVDPETGYVVDDTLAIEGAAADSKATGEAIAAVEAAIPAVDATLATTGAAADAKATGDEIADLKSAIQTKADVDGSYESMTVGNAEQLVSTVGIEDSTPYLLRTTGGSADIGDRVKLAEITGVSVPFNQTIQDVANTNPVGGSLTKDATNHTVKYEFSAPSNQNYAYLSFAEISKGLRHVIFASYVLADASEQITSVWGKVFHSGASISDTAVIGKRYTFLQKDGAIGWPLFGCSWVEGSVEAGTSLYFTFKDVMCIDLTLLFGSTIADYIYSLETATAGAGVAQLKAWGFCTKPYYAYDAGSLLSVETSAHREVGFQQWDEQWEVGGISSVDGSKYTDANRIRSKNYIPVLPNTQYYFRTPATVLDWKLVFYDAEKAFISYTTKKNQVFTTPTNCAYMMIAENATDYGTTYNHDICINLHWDGERDGEYEPYEEHTYPLDSDLVLRGIPKLDANNNLYYDGDEYESDGTVTRKYGIVDLGTVEWFYNEDSRLTAGGYFTARPAEIPLTNNSDRVCSKYPVVPQIGLTEIISTYGASVDKIAFAAGNDFIFVIDSAYSTPSDFTTAMSGVYMVYKLATPTTESADPYQETQICNDFGVEEFVDTRTVPIPVGYTALYQPNLRAKLEMAPDSPDGSGDFIVRQTNGTNEYVAISSNETISGLTTRCPACPTGTDGTFTLKATVSNGSITYSWESDT